MTERSPLASVIPLRASPAVRGWHGMIERPHVNYRQADWIAWGTIDPTGNARLVDVTPWSPAAKAGIASGDWMLMLNGECIDIFEARGAPVGTHVCATWHRPGIGLLAAELVLVPPPARKRRERQARPTIYPQVAPGRRLGSKERLQWQTAMQSDSALRAQDRDVANRLATKYADRRNMAWPSRATLARDLNSSIRTVHRSIVRLVWRGWLKVISGRRTGESNRYVLTWPAGC
jgi:Helix-turn-helix domain